MSDPNALPSEVRELLERHIESYEELELLLLLRRERSPEGFTAGRLIERLPHIPASLIPPALARLLASGLLGATGSDTPHYAYRPASPGIDTAAALLEREYAERPIRIMQLMSAHAIERVRTAALRTFAEAFVLKKD